MKIKSALGEFHKEMFGPLYFRNNKPHIRWFTVKITFTREWFEDHEGMIQPIPRRFGYCYKDFDTATRIYYLIPLNIIVAFCRWTSASLKYDINFYIEDKIRRIDNDRRTSKKMF